MRYPPIGPSCCSRSRSARARLAPGSAALVATFCATAALPFPFALFDVPQGNIQVHP